MSGFCDYAFGLKNSLFMVLPPANIFHCQSVSLHLTDFLKAYLIGSLFLLMDRVESLSQHTLSLSGLLLSTFILIKSSFVQVVRLFHSLDPFLCVAMGLSSNFTPELSHCPDFASSQGVCQEGLRWMWLTFS